MSSSTSAAAAEGRPWDNRGYPPYPYFKTFGFFFLYLGRLDDLGPRLVEQHRVALMRLLPALGEKVSQLVLGQHPGQADQPPLRRRRVAATTYVFQVLALVVLQQPVLAAEAALAEVAVPRDALRGRAAALERAADLLGHFFFFFFGCRRVGMEEKSERLRRIGSGWAEPRRVGLTEPWVSGVVVVVVVRLSRATGGVRCDRCAGGKERVQDGGGREARAKMGL